MFVAAAAAVFVAVDMFAVVFCHLFPSGDSTMTVTASGRSPHGGSQQTLPTGEICLQVAASAHGLEADMLASCWPTPRRSKYASARVERNETVRGVDIRAGPNNYLNRFGDNAIGRQHGAQIRAPALAASSRFLFSRCAVLFELSSSAV